jgi:hypothetical protein
MSDDMSAFQRQEVHHVGALEAKLRLAINDTP